MLKVTPILSDSDVIRYDRQIRVPDVGAQGMLNLLNSCVTIVGAGGLGCSAIQILAAAGVGHLRIIDGDRVELSNLPRQFLHYHHDVGSYKVDSISEKIHLMNPPVKVDAIRYFINPENCWSLLNGSDFVVVACDTTEAKYLLNDVCVEMGLPFTVAGVDGFIGQVLSVTPGQTRCLRCFHPDQDKETHSQDCTVTGVMGAVVSVAGAIQANEAIAWLIGSGNLLLDRVLLFNLIENDFYKLDISRSPQCCVCKNL